MNLWIIFLTGLTVGGLTCLAVQGGLLGSVITAREEEVQTNRKKHAIFATTAFITAKLLAYIAFGFVLGAFGGALQMNNSVQTYMQLAAGIYMLAVAANLLELHPVFRYALIQPPRSFIRLLRNQSRSKDIFAPALLGAMTVFIPCGTTLAMEALAVSSGNALNGAAIMGVFTLGTVPLFFGIGMLTSLLGEAFRFGVFKIAAILLIYLGLISIHGSLVAFGFDISSIFRSPAISNTISIPPTQQPKIFVTASGYSPQYIAVPQGKPVTLTLISQDAYSCAAAFRIPALKISRNLQPRGTETITFTPMLKGRILFTCSMGMYQGVIDVL